MTNFPDYMNQTEAQIIDRFMKAALEHQPALMLRIYDGEEWATEWTRNRDELDPEVAATDYTSIHVAYEGAEGAKHQRLGHVVFIHGNDEDVLSDYGWNPAVAGSTQVLDALCNAASPAWTE